MNLIAYLFMELIAFAVVIMAIMIHVIIETKSSGDIKKIRRIEQLEDKYLWFVR